MPTTSSKQPPAVGKANAPKDSGTVFASTHTVVALSNPAIASVSATSLPSGRVSVNPTGSSSSASHLDIGLAHRATSRNASPARAYAQPPRTVVHLNRPASTTVIDHHVATGASSSSIIAVKSASSSSRASLHNLSSTSSSLSAGGGLSGIGTSARGMPLSASLVSTFAIPMAPSEWLALSPEEARVYVKAVVKAAATDGAVRVPSGLVGHVYDEAGDNSSKSKAKKGAWKRIKAVFRPYDDNDKQFLKSLKYPPTWIPRIYALFCLPPTAPSGPTGTHFIFPPPTPLVPTKTSTSNATWLTDYLSTTPADDDPHLVRILPSNLPLHSTLWPRLLHTTRQIHLLRHFTRAHLGSLWELTYLAKEETLLAMMIATVGAQRRKCVQHVLEVARVLVVDRGVPAVVVAGELVAHVFDAKLDRVVVGRLSAWMVRVVCGRVAGPGPGPAAAAAVRRATGGSSMGGARTGTAASSCTSDGAARINTHVPPTPASSNDNTKHDTLPTQNLPHLTDPRFVVSTSTPDVNGPLPSSAQPIVTQRASKVDLVERSCQMIDLTQLGSDPAQSPTDTLHDSGASVGGRYRNTISAVNGRSVSHKSGHHGETRAERREEEEDGIEWKRRGTAPVMKGASRRASQAE